MDSTYTDRITLVCFGLLGLCGDDAFMEKAVV